MRLNLTLLLHRMGNDYRPVIHYRDLDAPREPDEFI